MSYLSENTNSSNARLVSSGTTNNNNNQSDAVAIQTIPVSAVLPKQGQVIVFNGAVYETQDLDGGYF